MWRASGLISDGHASFGLACLCVMDLLCVSDATHCTRLSNDVFIFFLLQSSDSLLCFSKTLPLFFTEFSVCPVRGGMPSTHAEGQ